LLEKYCTEDSKKWEKECWCIYIPTMDCNLKCPYCSMGCNNTQKDYYYATENDFQRLLDFLLLQKYEWYGIGFFGGEPTIHPKFREFNSMVEDSFGDNLTTVHTVSNFSKPLSYWKYNWPKKASFIASYHHWAIKNKQDEWFEKVYYMAQRGLVQCVRFVVTEGNEEEIIKTFQKYKREDLVKLWTLNPDEFNRDPEWRSQFESGDNNDKIDLGTRADRGPKSFYKMMCSAQYRIMENGDLYRCFAKLLDPQCKPTINVFKDRLVKLNKWHLCDTTRHCLNPTDRSYKKYSLQYFARNKDEIQKQSSI
jgi:organic radical activating enzyme